MKKKSAVSLGPGAPSLILIFVILALSMLSMLALMTGRNDARLSRRSVEVMEAVYQLNEQAEQTRASLDEILAGQAQAAENDAAYLQLAASSLPADMTMDGRDIIWTETDGARNLHCAVRLLPMGSGQRTQWVQHTLVARAAEEAEDDAGDGGFVEFD